MKTMYFRKGNKLDKKFSLTIEALAKKFVQSEFYKSGSYPNTFHALIHFIGSPYGLNSTYEIGDLLDDGENYELIRKEIRKIN